MRNLLRSTTAANLIDHMLTLACAAIVFSPVGFGVALWLVLR